MTFTSTFDQNAVVGGSMSNRTFIILVNRNVNAIASIEVEYLNHGYHLCAASRDFSSQAMMYAAQH